MRSCRTYIIGSITAEVEKIINQSNKVPRIMDPYVKGAVQDGESTEGISAKA